MTSRPLAPALLLCAALTSGAALAAQLQVTVTGADGRPAADVAVLVQPTAAWPAQPAGEPAVVAQQNIRFVPFVTVVPVGSTVRFVNRDRFDHHVRSLPGGPLGTVAPAREIDLRIAGTKWGKEAPPADLRLDVPGAIVLGCHLHGSMRGHVLVATTPWVAVTDERGVATLANLPDGQAELRLWHPDQLVEQAPQRLEAAGAMRTNGKLNFSPRPRSTAPAPGTTDRY